MRCLNEILEDFYFRYATFVIRYVYLFLIVPVVLTAILSSGFYFINIQFWNDTEVLFTPKDGYYKYEKRTFDEHFPLKDDYPSGQSFEVKHFFYIILTGKGKNNANLLRNDILDEIDLLNQYVLDQLSFTTYDEKQAIITYRAICLTSELLCFENPHVKLLRNRDQLEEYNNHIRYPVMRVPFDVLPSAFYVGGLLGAVTLNDTEGRIQDIGAIRLAYFMKQEPSEFFFYGIQFRDTLQEYLLKEYKSDLIDVSFGNDNSLTEGLQENTKRYLPEISVTVMLVFFFSFISSFIIYRVPNSGGTYIDEVRSNPLLTFMVKLRSVRALLTIPYIDWVRSKPLLTVMGIMVPGMAILSAIGFLLLVGCPFNDIIVVMPFIVFAIGVDDMFIMISAWDTTNFKDPPEKRFAEALSEAAVAVSITSITDIISFAMGTWNSLPAMQMFCYYSSVAMFFELFYQCTFYSAALYLVGRAESKGIHCFTGLKAKSFEEARTPWQKRLCVGTIMRKSVKSVKLEHFDQAVSEVITRKHTHTIQKNLNELQLDHFEHQQQSDHELTLVQTFFRKYFGPILLHFSTKIVVAFLFVAYLAFSIWGSMLMRNGLQPDKLVPKKHYVHKFLLADHYWNDGLPLQILLNNPPNVSIYENRRKIYAMVENFENTEHTMDRNYTMFWMREYELWLNATGFVDSPNATEFNPENVKSWFKSTGSREYWKTCIEWGNSSKGEDEIRAFRFSVGLKDYALPNQHQDAIVLMRKLFEKYPEYNITCYEHLSPYVDQYIMIFSTTIRNTIISLLIMIFIALLLIPHPICGLFMTISVLSIDVGVCGFLSWWDVSMDCISMVTMIMATGFAVDLSAHVSYAYVRAEGSANERAMKALETLGWPVFQGVTATFLGVLVMGFVDAYMFSVFFKTVFLVILFGLMHSLVFLPVALTVFVPRRLDTCRPKKIQSKITTTNFPIVENGNNSQQQSPS